MYLIHVDIFAHVHFGCIRIMFSNIVSDDYRFIFVREFINVCRDLKSHSSCACITFQSKINFSENLRHTQTLHVGGRLFHLNKLHQKRAQPPLLNNLPHAHPPLPLLPHDVS